MKEKKKKFRYFQTELGDRLLVNFNTTSGLPLAEINIKRKTASSYRYESILFFLLFKTFNLLAGLVIPQQLKLELFNLKCVIYHELLVIKNMKFLLFDIFL